jgi:hypothetical protein
MRRVLDLVLSASMECGSTVPRPAADCDWCNCRRAAASTLCVILRCVRQCLTERSYGHRRRAMRYLLPAHGSEAASRVDALLHVALLLVMSVPWLGLAVSERPCTSSAQCPVFSDATGASPLSGHYPDHFCAAQQSRYCAVQHMGIYKRRTGPPANPQMER